MSEFTCVECGATDRKAHRGLCWTCYRKDIYAKRPQATCHPERRAHAGGLCRPCYNSGERAKRAECHPERLHVAKGLCRECYNNLPENKERAIKARRLRKYKLTPDEFEQIGERQNWRCAICGARPTAVDHCHDSGDVRGLLCHQCNAGLGHFKDSPEILIAAAAYIEESRIERQSQG